MSNNEENKTFVMQARMVKLRKKIPDEQIAEIEAMDELQLRNRISRCEQHILECESAREMDEELKGLKERVKMISGSYSEVKKAQRALAEYAACMLDINGSASSEEDSLSGED